MNRAWAAAIHRFNIEFKLRAALAQNLNFHTPLTKANSMDCLPRGSGSGLVCVEASGGVRKNKT